MGSTNKTTNLELSQFLGTDKPSWLNDYNADMLAIDTAVGRNVTDISTAQSRADSAYTLADNTASSVSSLSTQVGTNTTDIATAQGNITTINSLIGNGTPTTTDQTIIGAINEIVNGSAYNVVASVTGDGTTTYANKIAQLWSLLSNDLPTIRDNIERYCVVFVRDNEEDLYHINYVSDSSINTSRIAGSADTLNCSLLSIASTANCVYTYCAINTSGVSFTDLKSNAMSSNQTIKIVTRKY